MRAITGGPSDAETYRSIRSACEHFKDELKANIKEYSANDFEHAKHFLDSLEYEVHFPNG